MLRHVGLNVKTSKDKLPTKVVIRRLPPTFTNDIFMAHVSPLPNYNYMYFVKANGENRQHSYSRAYINFVDGEDVLTFKSKYDNYVFLGSNGLEYTSVVELAPFQNIPKDGHSKKKDFKSDTIQHDGSYLKFIESLNCKREDVERPEFSLQLKSEKGKTVTMTPLLKYVNERKNERKNVAERQSSKNRNYENCVVFVNSTVKKNHLYHLKYGNRKSRCFN